MTLRPRAFSSRRTQNVGETRAAVRLRAQGMLRQAILNCALPPDESPKASRSRPWRRGDPGATPVKRGRCHERTQVDETAIWRFAGHHASVASLLAIAAVFIDEQSAQATGSGIGTIALRRMAGDFSNGPTIQMLSMGTLRRFPKHTRLEIPLPTRGRDEMTDDIRRDATQPQRGVVIAPARRRILRCHTDTGARATAS